MADWTLFEKTFNSNIDCPLPLQPDATEVIDFQTAPLIELFRNDAALP